MKAVPISTLAATLCFPLLALAAPAVGGDITVSNNKAGNVTVIGGKVSAGVGPVSASLNLQSKAYVNSIAVNGGSVGGKITVANNKAGNVTAIGGLAAVNSVVVNAR